MIAIVDYGMGNLRSVQKGFERVGHTAAITDDPCVVASAAKVVLPGVGGFDDAMQQLRRRDLVQPLCEVIDAGRPFLGICLGLQLLFDVGHEDGHHQGLGILRGEVVRFNLSHEYKVPHMGWNTLRVARRPPLLEEADDEAYYYFVHSYYVVPGTRDVIATETDYGDLFTSMVWRDNLYATQFHPEKSQAVGLGILKRFAEL